MNWMVWLPVVGYLLLVLWIGVFTSRRIKSTSDYIVAGRHLPPWVLAGTLAATGIGGGATLGVAGNAYSKWGASAFWYVASMGIAYLLMSCMAPMLRKSRARTVPEFFRKIYGKPAGLFHSIVTIVSMIGITAAQLKASATVLEVMGGMDYNTALLVVAVVITSYSIMGGFWSVAITDVIQLILIFVGMGAAVPYALHMAGGWTGMTARLSEEALQLTAGIGGWSSILAYVIMFFTAYMVGEEVASSYFAAQNARSARIGSLLAAVITLAFAAIPTVLGLAMKSMYESGELNAGVIQALNQNTKYALPALAANRMPVPLAGIIFAGILAATMSSADSALLGAGSVYSSDIYKVFVNREAHPERILKVARVSTVFFMMFSFFTAIYGGNILTIIAVSFCIRAAGSFVPYIMGLLWKRNSGTACLFSMMAGTAVYIVSVALWKLTVVHALYPALVVSGIAYFAIALLPDREG